MFIVIYDMAWGLECASPSVGVQLWNSQACDYVCDYILCDEVCDYVCNYLKLNVTTYVT